MMKSIYSKLMLILSITIILVSNFISPIKAIEERNIYIDDSLVPFYELLKNTYGFEERSDLPKNIISDLNFPDIRLNGRLTLGITLDGTMVNNSDLMTGYFSQICKEDVNARVNQAGTKDKYICVVDRFEVGRLIKEVIDNFRIDLNGNVSSDYFSITSNGFKVKVNSSYIQKYKSKSLEFDISETKLKKVDKYDGFLVNPRSATVLIFGVKTNPDVNAESYNPSREAYQVHLTSPNYFGIKTLTNPPRIVNGINVYEHTVNRNNYTNRFVYGYKRLSSSLGYSTYMIYGVNDINEDNSTLTVNFDFRTQMTRDKSQIIPLYYASNVKIKDGNIDFASLSNDFKKYYSNYDDYNAQLLNSINQSDPIEDRTTHLQTDYLNSSSDKITEITNSQNNQNLDNARDKVENFNPTNFMSDNFELSITLDKFKTISEFVLNLPGIKELSTIGLVVGLCLFFIGRK